MPLGTRLWPSYDSAAALARQVFAADASQMRLLLFAHSGGRRSLAAGIGLVHPKKLEADGRLRAASNDAEAARAPGEGGASIRRAKRNSSGHVIAKAVGPRDSGCGEQSADQGHLNLS